MALNQNSMSKLSSLYASARHVVALAGYSHEIAWTKDIAGKNFTESEFLREAAWVVLCSGFKESTVRSKFDYISLCFFDWESAEEIETNSILCISTASAVFRNERKLKAIVEIASTIAQVSFARFRKSIDQNPLDTLTKLPFIGPITSQHLAKNLGYPFAKHDRHMARLSKQFGYTDTQTFCRDIAIITGDPIPVIDSVLWRYASIT